MTPDLPDSLPNYYEYLDVAPDSSISRVREAYQRLFEDTQVKLNNPWTMQSALAIQNTILPGIQQHLLSSNEARVAYDQQLLAKQRRQVHREELADDQGLDDSLRRPFFFDPFDGYDVEIPAFSLRQIATKLDREWEQARLWIQDTSDEHHAFVGYLKMVAGRPSLAERVEGILHAVNQTGAERMVINEGIERCVTIFDPAVERARVAVMASHFDGKNIDAGDFISDLPAQTEITFYHEGVRGCVFGTIESRTSWATFPEHLTAVHYALMPQGTKAEMGLAEITLPLIFHVHDLPRGSEQRHTAELVVRMENHEPVKEYTVLVHMYVLALPPRVFFEPPASRERPLLAGVSHKNSPVRVIVVPRNAGDEKAVPLSGRIFTREPGASAQPERFHANEPITLIIDNHHRAFGTAYQVTFTVDYGLTSGARGPETLYVCGEVLPTVWQSMLRKRPGVERAVIGLGIGLCGFVLGGASGDMLATRFSSWSFLGLILPFILIGMVRGAATTLLGHKEMSGAANVRITQVPNWILWWTPLGSVLVLILMCALLSSNPGAAFALAGLFWLAPSAVFGFIFDASRPSSQRKSA
jgi:hypothetical protein